MKVLLPIIKFIFVGRLILEKAELLMIIYFVPSPIRPNQNMRSWLLVNLKNTFV